MPKADYSDKQQLSRSSVLATVLVLALLRIGAQLEVLGALDGRHSLGLAFGALELQHDLLGCLCLLVEHRLGLSAESLLLLLVTSVTLSLSCLLAGLVLGDLVRGVLLALLAIRVPCLRNVHHGCRILLVRPQT